MLKIEDNMVKLTSGKLELLIYQKYLGNLAEINGRLVESIGILPYRWYAKVNDTKPTKIGTLTMPSSMIFYPLEISMDQTISVYPESDPKEYTILTFYEKDKCWSPTIIQSIWSGMTFTQALLAGRLDTNIPYNILSPYWQKLCQANNFSIGITGPAMDIVVRHIARWKKDRSVFYSQMLEKDPKVGQVSYILLNSRELASENGVFASISFEDINAAIDNSIGITTTGKRQVTNPIEDIIYL